MTPRIVTAFRIVSFLEAMSWIGLLIGMYFKWIAETSEAGVKVFGPIHGAVFVTYVVIALLTARRLRWPLTWTTLFALAASIPPLATIWFEEWARRTGRLEVRTAELQTATAIPNLPRASPLNSFD